MNVARTGPTGAADDSRGPAQRGCCRRVQLLSVPSAALRLPADGGGVGRCRTPLTLRAQLTPRAPELAARGQARQWQWQWCARYRDLVLSTVAVVRGSRIIGLAADIEVGIQQQVERDRGANRGEARAYSEGLRQARARHRYYSSIGACLCCVVFVSTAAACPDHWCSASAAQLAPLPHHCELHCVSLCHSRHESRASGSASGSDHSDTDCGTGSDVLKISASAVPVALGPAAAQPLMRSLMLMPVQTPESLPLYGWRGHGLGLQAASSRPPWRLVTGRRWVFLKSWM